jgi:hypothetical protein
MAKLSLRLGIALVVLGVLSWVIAGFESPTALIPAFLGAPIAACGYFTIQKPEKSVIFMHIAVVLAAILFLGSASRIPSLDEFGSIKSVSIWTAAFISFVLIGAFVQSFLKARAAKKS